MLRVALNEKNTLFDSLIKNLENDEKLYSLIEKIVIAGESIEFNRYEPTMDKGDVYGIIRCKNGKTIVHNKIFERIIYDYMIAKKRVAGLISLKYETESRFMENGALNMVTV